MEHSRSGAGDGVSVVRRIFARRFASASEMSYDLMIMMLSPFIKSKTASSPYIPWLYSSLLATNEELYQKHIGVMNKMY